SRPGAAPSPATAAGVHKTGTPRAQASRIFILTPEAIWTGTARIEPAGKASALSAGAGWTTTSGLAGPSASAPKRWRTAPGRAARTAGQTASRNQDAWRAL